MLKVHGRCDLACDHCYIYEHADFSWRTKPREISLDTVRAAASRIAEHASAHRLPGIVVVLHGGEPLLLGTTTMRAVLRILRGTIEPVTRLDLRMQSNGVRLTPAVADLLVEFDVAVGISLDGDRLANDRHRRFAHGASSHEDVLRALELLRQPAFRRQYAGILCTVDVRNDPIRVYEALIAEAPPRLDLLIPHATWDQPPPRPEHDPTPYAHWLLRIYDRWVADGRPVPIRLFDSLRSTSAGGPSGNEWVGLDPADVVVIEVDGTWEQVDSLKTAYDGAPYTGLDVFTDPVDTVAALPQIQGRQLGLAGLAADCQRCPVVEQCGGGLYAHRYRSGAGFDNPSAYCADLKELIVSINDRLAAEFRTGTGGSAGSADWPVPDRLVEQVGSGQPDEESVAYLAAHQYFRAQNLVSDLGFQSRSGQDALAQLRSLDREAPQAVEIVLSHPYLRPWALAERARHTTSAPASASALGNLVMAAAVHADASLVAEVPVRAGEIHLPTVGTILLSGDPFTAELSLSRGRLMVRHGGESTVLDPDQLDPGQLDPMLTVDTPTWRPSRWLPFGESSLLLEDLDLARNCHGWDVEARGEPAQAQAWRYVLAQAQAVIAREMPDQLPALYQVLRAIVPLRPNPTGGLRSSTARRVVGSVGIAYTPDEESFAVLLLHEFQHTILDALLDMVDLVQQHAHDRLRVGWRGDPRPIEAALQGAYAHLTIADVWRRRAEFASDAGAAAQYRKYRAWTADAVAGLLASAGLTATGVRFVESMAGTLRTWPA